MDGNNNNAHATLGLDQGDPSLTEEEVRLAYRTAVKLVHPDLGGRDPAEVARREKLTLALHEADAHGPHRFPHHGNAVRIVAPHQIARFEDGEIRPVRVLNL